MKYPKFISKGATLGLPTPSASVRESSQKKYLDAVEKLKKLGHHIVESENRFNNSLKVVSGPPQKRAEEFMKMWEDQNIDALISVAGGEFMVQILPYLDAERMKNAGVKWFAGYSDNTVLVHYLATVLNVASIYHYNVDMYGMKKWHETSEDAYKLLFGKKFVFNSTKKYQPIRYHEAGQSLPPLKLTRKTKWKLASAKTEETFEGRIIGGCLDILQVFAGTAFDNTKNFIKKYSTDGIIWYMEVYDLNPADIKRILWKLEHCGWFEHVKGFLIGRPMVSEDVFGITHDESFVEMLEKFKVPIIFDTDIGHVLPSIPVINGAIAKVNYKNNKGSIEYTLR